MTKFQEGSQWVVEAGLDPDLASIDRNHLVSTWPEKLRAMGEVAIGIFRFEHGGRAYCISPFYSASIPLKQTERLE